MAYDLILSYYYLSWSYKAPKQSTFISEIPVSDHVVVTSK